MKKLLFAFVALFAAVAMLFALTACGSEEKLTPTDAVTDVNERYTVGIEELAVNKDMRDSKGNVSYKLNLVFPQLDAASFTNAEAINSVYVIRSGEMQTFAQNNVENASKFISENDGAMPWESNARYSVTYRDAKYLCILCEYSYGMGSQSRSKRLVSDCFLLSEGTQCSINDFLIEGIDADAVYGFLADKVLEKMVDSKGASRLSDGIGREQLIEKFSPSDFYITDTGITFYYQLATIAPFSEGVLEFSFSAEEVSSMMTLPITK